MSRLPQSSECRPEQARSHASGASSVGASLPVNVWRRTDQALRTTLIRDTKGSFSSTPNTGAVTFRKKRGT